MPRIAEAQDWSRRWAAVEHARAGAGTGTLPPDDLDREVYCVLGMPVDAIDMATALARIEAAADGIGPFLVSTCNLNFLASSLSDAEFRESLLLSDLCTADGAPILWLARLLGIPLEGRVAGSDMFDALGARRSGGRQLTTFLLGGPPGVADAACRALNSGRVGLKCAGSMYPGYGTLDDLSSAPIIDAVNSSRVDFLAVALGAAKGQAWLRHNHDRLRVPVRAHLGATLAFQAGTLKRAPRFVRSLGLEWLWRIKEEPHLWLRYGHDGFVLLHLLVARVLPLAVRRLRDRVSGVHARSSLRIAVSHDRDSVVLRLSGDASARHVGSATVHFRDALDLRPGVVAVDLSEARTIDARFLGLLLMVRKRMGRQGARMEIVRASAAMERLFRLNGAAYLLPSRRGAPC
jgi:N-acetylglucosaminyldiphosphoundecaprenol N-acetyl-beta-D-mannosaminyltransferase